MVLALRQKIFSKIDFRKNALMYYRKKGFLGFPKSGFRASFQALIKMRTKSIMKLRIPVTIEILPNVSHI